VVLTSFPSNRTDLFGDSMTTPDITRKLAAVLSGEVKRYSRLLVRDEVGTLRTLTTYKDVMARLIERYGGTVINVPGDHVLAEFPDASEAVACAVEIQKELKKRNDEVPEPQRMEFRFGIDRGEVVTKEGTMFGDGVNVAVRIRSFADAGGMCVSGAVFEQIKDTSTLRFDYLGKQKVQNIQDPVRIYRVLREGETVSFVQRLQRFALNYWKRFSLAITILVALVGLANGLWQLYPRLFRPAVEVASREKMAFPLPDKPAIAVLPFVNMSGDPKQDLFCDGITVEINNALSKVPYVFVIAPTSMTAYKGKATSAKQVAEDLGVQYVLEGTVRMSGDAVRVTAELIDALKGYNLWSERYDRSVKDIFALEDEITMKILTELQVKLTDGEMARVYPKGTQNLQAYLKVLEGNWYQRQFNKDSEAKAQRLYGEAIDLDPHYVVAYTQLAWSLAQSPLYGPSESPEETLSKALKSAQKAVALASTSGDAYASLSWVFLMMHQYDKAIEAGERAVKLNPNSAAALNSLGWCLTWTWRGEEAIPLLQQAIRLNPLTSAYHRQLGIDYRQVKRYEEGIAAVKKALKLAPNDILSHIALTGLYMDAGRTVEARAAVQEVYRINPYFSLANYEKTLPAKEGPEKDRYFDAIRKAGLK
jgi:adenylate cyclase